MWEPWVQLALAVWLWLSRGLLDFGSPEARANDLWVSIALALSAGLVLLDRRLRWVQFALGFWLVLAPAVLGYRSAAPTINATLVGTLVMIFALSPRRLTRPLPAAARSTPPVAPPAR